MKRLRLLIFLVAGITLSLVLLARTLRELSRLDASLTASTRERSGLEDRINQANRVPVQIRSNPPAAGSLVNARTPVERAYERNPRFQALFLGSKRFQIRTDYQPFVRRTGLSGEQESALSSAILRRREAQMDIAAAGREQGLEANEPALARMRAQADAELRSAEGAILGEPRLQQLQDYERGLPAQEAARTFAAAAIIGETPLNTDQIDRLTQIVEDESPDFQSGQVVDLRKIDQNQFVSRVRVITSASQLRAIEYVIALQRAQAALGAYISGFQAR